MAKKITDKKRIDWLESQPHKFCVEQWVGMRDDGGYGKRWKSNLDGPIGPDYRGFDSLRDLVDAAILSRPHPKAGKATRGKKK